MQHFLSTIPPLGQNAFVEGDEGHHLAKVKRCQINEEVKLFDGNGVQARAKVIDISKKGVLVEILERNIFTKPEIKTVLCIVPPKGKNFSLLLEKVVEIGVDEIIPLTSERSVKEYQPEKEEKYEKILLEASKQCERSYLPILKPLMTFQDSLAFFQNPHDLKLLFHTKNGGKFWENAGKIEKGGACCFWIGPEGGWSENEIVFARSKNALICTLPMPILRVETAVISVSSLLKTYLG
jgi:16S rRNA (uracil1498-N3)-methyltransferase